MNIISSKDHKHEFIRKQFKKLAYALTHNELQKVHEILSKLIAYTNFLAIVPPEYFTNAYFPGCKYDDLRSTVTKSFNSWILEDHDLPITSMFDLI